MATLQETTVFPHDLLASKTGESQQQDGDGDRRWWVLYTKARHEKAVARQLLARGIPFYLPLMEKAGVSRGRKVTSIVPVFPGYVFLFGDAEDRRISLETNRISQVLPVMDSPEMFRDLRQVQQLLESRAPLTIESRLAIGQRVRVKHGSFANLEGTVLMRRGETRLVIAVEFLQQGASIAIDDFMLEPIG